MSLDECMGKYTNRQYRTFLEWDYQQLNNPSLTDQYLIQLTDAVDMFMRLFTQEKTPRNNRLKFGKRPKPTPESIELEKARQVAAAKAVWRARRGG